MWQGNDVLWYKSLPKNLFYFYYLYYYILLYRITMYKSLYFLFLNLQLKLKNYPNILYYVHTTVKIMILSRYRYRPITVPLLILAGVTHNPSSWHSRPSPSPTVLEVTVENGEGRECHDDGRSVTTGHDDLNMVTGR